MPRSCLAQSTTLCAVWFASFAVAALADPSVRPNAHDGAATWTVTSGSLVFELDPGAFAALGLPLPRSSEHGSPENALILNVEESGSDLSLVTTDRGQVLAMGYLQGLGTWSLPLGLAPQAGESAVGDFVVTLDPRGGRITDQASIFRDVFVLDGAQMSVELDESSRTAFISAPLAISDSFAEEVLRSPESAGTLTGFAFFDLSIERINAGQLGHAEGRSDDADPRGGTTGGPDVIVSGIGSTFQLYGTVGGFAGYAMTTVSCNLGEDNAIWIDCTNGGPNCNQHPVIGQNLYRLKDGRFEQIGMSWLKHGFCAADAPSCGSPYEPHGSCDWLGTHATDTYTSSLNGNQPDLGPRSEVNAWTGVYPYPYVLNWFASGNAPFKRLRVPTGDLDPAQNPGASYVGESQYVCTDEQPSRRYNNVSWRRVNVGSFNGSMGSWNLSFSGSTVAQQAAIEAWPVLDSFVTLVDIFVPGDGRMILGYKVTGLGGGQWHYEYALYNMNCDRSVRGFSVPAGGVMRVRDIGFHDVDHHSGEPYSTLDWPGARSNGIVSWQTSTFGANPNANALRWGSLFNFRFDSNTPPTSGNVIIELFKPGSPTTVSVSASVPSVVAIEKVPY